MIFLPKTDRPDLQAILDREAAKASGSYLKEEIVDQVEKDSHGKCYLCEDAEPTSIQVEHLVPHRDDARLKFSWSNLLYACAHCNGTKGARYHPILDCSRDNSVWGQVKLVFTRFPKARIEVWGQPVPGKETQCENTVRLLEESFQGKTPIRKRESENLRKKMIRADIELSQAIQGNDQTRVIGLVSAEASFAGMQRWTLCLNHPDLWSEIRSQIA